MGGMLLCNGCRHASKYPEQAPQLFAYNKTIVKASQTFENPAWVSYDIQFRRKAALTGSFAWGTIDTALYNETFTGRARVRPHCRLCYSEAHSERACPLVSTVTTPNNHNNTNTNNNTGYSGHGNRTQQASLRYGSRPPTHRAVELCGLFNKGECRFRDCKYAHICSMYRQGPHPAARCQSNRERSRRAPLLLDPAPGPH